MRFTATAAREATTRLHMVFARLANVFYRVWRLHVEVQQSECCRFFVPHGGMQSAGLSSIVEKER